jgi:pimeloyl-ACP methyl ester carboxylesterase
MRADTTGGHLTRVFTVHGETKEYRERLTWFSESERSMRYTHVAGIAGAQAYDAMLSVSAEGNDCVVTMAAEMSAAEPRATEIAAGTQAIFESGLEVLAGLEHHTPDTAETAQPLPEIQTRMVGQIAVSLAQHPMSDTLVLFLHGIGGSRHNWTRQLAAIQRFCNVAAIDLRGYGDSALRGSQSSVNDYCNDIIAVVDALQVKHLILCGLSYGAWIATSYAMRAPEHLSALILAGGCTGMSEAGPTVRDAFREAREKPLSEGQTPADFAPDVIPALAGPDCSEAVRDELLTSMSAIPSATYADALRCFTNPTEMFDFSRITCPVLMMTGEFDRLAPPREIKSVAERIFDAAQTPDVRFECLPRAGHVCNLETPDAFNGPLLELVKRVAL